ncbi:MAG: hypothetical protein AAGD38_19420, partial [Acidobacteriota bacterium]
MLVLRSSLVLFIISTLLSSAAILAQSETFTDTTSTIVVEVPVEVTLDGEPLRGLDASNFEIVDGRKEREIVGFDVVDLSDVDARAASTGEIPVIARRHFLFLFDLGFADAQSVERAREAALEVVSNDLHPADLVAVGTYSEQIGSVLQLGFTPDRNQARNAINSLSIERPGLIQTVDTLRLTAQGIANDAATGTDAGGGGASGGAAAEARSAADDQVRSFSQRVDLADDTQERG